MHPKKEPLNPICCIPICPYMTPRKPLYILHPYNMSLHDQPERGSMPNAASNRLAKTEFSATAGGSESLEAL